jgi:hypothetical protein
VLSEDHPSTLTSMNNLAGVLRDQGNYEEAEEVHRRVLRLRERVLGKEHPATLTSIINLAYTWKSQGRDKEAIDSAWSTHRMSGSFDTGTYQMLKPHTRGWNTIQAIRGHRRRREVGWEMGGEAPCLMNIEMSERGDVAMFDEVIGVYAKHHECSLPKDKVYRFRELVPQWKENLVVDYKRSDLEVFLDVAKLDFHNQKL